VAIYAEGKRGPPFVTRAWAEKWSHGDITVRPASRNFSMAGARKISTLRHGLSGREKRHHPRALLLLEPGKMRRSATAATRGRSQNSPKDVRRLLCRTRSGVWLVARPVSNWIDIDAVEGAQRTAPAAIQGPRVILEGLNAGCLAFWDPFVGMKSEWPPCSSG